MWFGIFNIDKIEKTSEYKKLYDNLNEKKSVEDISCNQKNSFILTEDKGNIKGYISNIGTNTMKRRRIV